MDKKKCKLFGKHKPNFYTEIKHGNAFSRCTRCGKRIVSYNCKEGDDFSNKEWELDTELLGE